MNAEESSSSDWVSLLRPFEPLLKGETWLGNIPLLILATGLSFLFLILLFRPIELLFPAKKQKFKRPDWWTDVFFFLGQYLIWGGLVFLALQYGFGWLREIVPADFRAAVADQPFWLQILEIILISDFCIYWAHRFQHRNAFLWRFHAVHHSAEHLDWLAAHREHPLDTIYTVGIINLPAFLAGFPLETLAGFLAFRGIWAIFIHSNVRLPIGPLRWFVGAPELHHWHHDRNRDAGNYANLSPLMDIAFGTYVCPDHEPESVGVNEPFPKSYVGQLLHPLGVPVKTQPPADPPENHEIDPEDSPSNFCNSFRHRSTQRLCRFPPKSGKTGS